jgi:hypothetical protein
MEGLNSWLQEVEAFLQAEKDVPVGDIETLEAQLEQSNVSSLFMFWNFGTISLGEIGIERMLILVLALLSGSCIFNCLRIGSVMNLQIS